jgi:hypothetical protein
VDTVTIDRVNLRMDAELLNALVRGTDYDRKNNKILLTPICFPVGSWAVAASRNQSSSGVASADKRS